MTTTSTTQALEPAIRTCAHPTCGTRLRPSNGDDLCGAHRTALDRSTAWRIRHGSRAILDALADGNLLNATQLAERTGFRASTLREDLLPSLVRAGSVEMVGRSNWRLASVKDSA